MGSSPEPRTRLLRERLVAGLRGTAPAGDPVRTALGQFPVQVAEVLFPVTPTPAAVLVPIVEDGRGLSLLLTRRSAHLRDHPGQISFPGGRLEPGEPEPVTAALREAAEEIGLAGDYVDVAGYLPPQAVVTGFVITPVVGFVRAGHALTPDPAEVAEIFLVPLQFLLAPGTLETGSREYRGVTVTAHAWRFGDYRIWGATANILKSLVDLLHEAR